MESDRQSVAADEPESWYFENAIARSDDVEEIVQQDGDTLRPPSKDLGTLPRLVRPVRRRLNPGEKVCRREDITKTYHVTTLDMPRNMDGLDASTSSNLTLVASASPSCTDPWSSSGFVREEAHVNWDDQDEDMLLVPKLEPVEDDVDMTELNESTPPDISSASTSPVTVKRPRGRPRKHPKVKPDSLMKVAKGRSKTGCITCRKRKKKCDEAKPGCESDLERTDTPFSEHC